jgi:hypothetical protein
MRVAVGSDHAGRDLEQIRRAFLSAPEEHGRHDLRIEKLAALDGERAGRRSLEGIP